MSWTIFVSSLVFQPRLRRDTQGGYQVLAIDNMSTGIWRNTIAAASHSWREQPWMARAWTHSLAFMRRTRFKFGECRVADEVTCERILCIERSRTQLIEFNDVLIQLQFRAQSEPPCYEQRSGERNWSNDRAEVSGEFQEKTSVYILRIKWKLIQWWRSSVTLYCALFEWSQLHRGTGRDTLLLTYTQGVAQPFDTKNKTNYLSTNMAYFMKLVSVIIITRVSYVKHLLFSIASGFLGFKLEKKFLDGGNYRLPCFHPLIYKKIPSMRKPTDGPPAEPSRWRAAHFCWEIHGFLLNCFRTQSITTFSRVYLRHVSYVGWILGGLSEAGLCAIFAHSRPNHHWWLSLMSENITLLIVCLCIRDKETGIPQWKEYTKPLVQIKFKCRLSLSEWVDDVEVSSGGTSCVYGHSLIVTIAHEGSVSGISKSRNRNNKGKSLM